jgi:DNA-binding NarL/FixJ family response regulator
MAALATGALLVYGNKENEAMSHPAENSATTAQAVPVRVAMVEDEREIRDSWVKLLGTFPDFACVCTCASGEDALKQLPSIRPQIVLMDIFLPRMSGIECTAKLKELLPNAHILILTSVADDELVFMALQAGADGYLLKSTQPAELEAALRDLLRGGAPMTGAVARRVVRYFRQKKKPKDTALGLSTREEEVLILLSKGYGNKEIAAQLSLSVDTVSTYLKQIYKKLHVHSRTEAVMRYAKAKAG